MKNKQDLSEAENKIFYSLGAPIRITNQGCSGLSLYIARKEYDAQELHQSFTEENMAILLFKTEQEALAYSRFVQIKPEVDSGLEAFQRPVFKVQFLGDVNSLSYKKEDIMINEYVVYNKGFFDGKSMKSEMTISYCEVKRKEVEPIFASLNVYALHDHNGFNEAKFCTPLTLDYTKDLTSQLQIKEAGCVIF